MERDVDTSQDTIELDGELDESKIFSSIVRVFVSIEPMSAV